MVKPPSFDRYGMKKGAWDQDEDNKLRACIDEFGHSNWRLVPIAAGLKRCGKSCRLRWMNYLKPGLKRGNFTKHEEHLIIELHNQLGNKWSAIAAHFPQRTDNDIKNYFHAHIKKRKSGIRAEIVIEDDSNSCITSNQEKAENMGGDVESINEMGMNLSELLDEEIYGSELLRDYSWNYTSLVGEEDCFDMGQLWS